MDEQADNGQPERRKSWRIRVEIRVEVAEPGEEIEAFSEDLGGGGARFICKHRFQPGDIVTIRIPQFGTSRLAAEVLDCADIDYKKECRTRVRFIDPDPSTVKQLLDFLYNRSINR